MTTKELIQNEIEQLDEKALEELYLVVKKFMQSRQEKPKSKRKKEKTLFELLSEIQIDGPTDLSINHDLYFTGEKTC